uniref:Reverse transcriptase/retrotransposon-derived protein RNase H-like domain-containing protein n=1 Tax=Cannabis sativa TaxID=3483 RepID=A0A803QSJ7_CANSA
MAWPLREQSKKEKFGWNEATTIALVALKQTMTMVHMLALPDFDQCFVVEIDASRYDVGVVLMQNQRHVAYYMLLRYQKNATPVSSADEMLEERDAQLDDLKMHLLRAQQKMKDVADKNKRDEQFSVDKKVFVKLKRYRQKSLASRRNEKLSSCFYGPFDVFARIGTVAYKLALPATSSVHPVFHVSQLQRAHGVTHSSSLLPP